MTWTLRGMLLGLAVLLFVSPALAEFYKWTDANGIVHFTANLDEVPPSQRTGAAAGSGSKGSFQRMGTDAPAAPAPTANDSRLPATSPVPVIPKQASPETHGGRTEAQWQSEAQRYRDAIASLEPAAEQCKGDSFRYTEGAGQRKWQEETDEAQACSRVQSDLDMNRRGLESLDERAHRAGVPPGWIRD